MSSGTATDRNVHVSRRPVGFLLFDSDGVKDDAFDATASITLCPFTTHVAAAPLLRLNIEPSPKNGLSAASQLMIDKITTVPKNKLESRIGRLSVEDIVRLHRAVCVFLGLAGSASSARDSD